MAILRNAARVAAMAGVLSLFASVARADIVFVDVNHQPGERATAEALAKKYGETFIVVDASNKPIQDALEDVFKDAEAGKADITTLIVSGHSNGQIFFSHSGDFLYNLDDLAKKYPKAAEQVKSFIGLGCYTGTNANSGAWQQSFPEASMIAGFGGSGPSGSWSERFLNQVYSTWANARKRAGGSDKLADKLAKDRSARANLERSLDTLDAMRTTTGTYTVCGNFHDRRAMSKDHLERAVIIEGPALLQQYFDGDLPTPSDTGHSPLRNLYNDVQGYLAYATDDQRAQLLEMRDRILRLMFFDNVKKNIVKNEAADIAKLNDALAKAGEAVRVPDETGIAALDRKGVLKLVHELELGKESIDDPAIRKIAIRLGHELRDLDPSLVDAKWVE